MEAGSRSRLAFPEMSMESEFEGMAAPTVLPGLATNSHVPETA
jgi:hypothetical protein